MTKEREETVVGDFDVRPPKRRQHLGDEAASYIRDLIMSGRVGAGDHLRVDPLAAEMGMSATPVREGLITLRNEGLVSLEPNRGFRVGEIPREDVRDIFTAQGLLAGELAARAASAISKEDLARLAELSAATERGLRAGPPSDIAQLNFEFHRTINRAAGSRKLSLFLSTAVRYVPYRFYASVPGWPEATLADHLSILDAIRRRSERDARETMQMHIQHASDLLVAHLEENGFWSTSSPSWSSAIVPGS